MAHITGFKVFGLLGRSEPVSIQLNRDVNIIFGENGCGKTTLLKILDAALSLDSATMHRLPVQRAEVEIYSITDEKPHLHVWDRKPHSSQSALRLAFSESELSDFPETARREFFRTAAISDWMIQVGKKLRPPTVERWAHNFLPTTRLYAADTVRRPAGKQISEEQIDEAFAETVNKLWLVHYTKILSEVRQIQNDGLKSVLYQGLSSATEQPVGPTLDPAVAFSQVKKFIERQAAASEDMQVLGSSEKFAKRYQQEPSLMRLVDSINTVETRIEAAIKPIENFMGAVDSLFSRGKKIQPKEKGLEVVLPNGNVISPANLSSGEKHLLRILLAAMTSESNSVIVDEPELSMHIDWQRELVRTAQALNPHCQLILASHSPEIMADIPDSRIFNI